jgi:putative transposase
MIVIELNPIQRGRHAADVTRKLGISGATFYAWRKRFGSMGTEIRELRQSA